MHTDPRHGYLFLVSDTTRTETQEVPAMSATVTPSHRFEIVARRNAAERAGRLNLARVLRRAHLVESFPGSYEPAEVEAATALLLAMAHPLHSIECSRAIEAMAPFADAALPVVAAEAIR